jgi:hypothetical protein
MEYWEFLLQQEGDSSWLPLDTSQMEILEGRYRIMAHCSASQTPVQIHISQIPSDRVSPKRRSLNRQGQTNENGLVVILPFTRLNAGTWDIYCRDAASTNLSEADSTQPESNFTSPVWEHAIQLRVLPAGVGEDADWFADDGGPQSLHEPQPSQTDSENSPVAPMADAAEPGKQPGAVSPSSETLSGFDLEPLVAVLDQAQPHFDAPDSGESLYTLTLDQTALLATQAQPTLLTGQASSVIDGESCSDMVLVARLSDPQTAEVLGVAPFRIESKVLPAPFSVAIPLPTALSTRLLLGELALIAQQGSAPNLLALQRFTVTVDLAALLDEIANQAESEGGTELIFAPDLLPAEQAPTPQQPGSDASPDWDRVTFPTAPPRSVPSVTLPRDNPTIPPKIYYPSPHEVSARKPVLPPLGQVKPSSEPAEESEPAPTGRAETAKHDPETGSIPADLSPQAPPTDLTSSDAAPLTDAKPSTGVQGLSLPPLKAAENERTKQPRPKTESGGQASDSATTTPEGTDRLMLPSHETMAFQSLNLQERFWTRLNDLATTLQQEAQEVTTGSTAAQTHTDLDDAESHQPRFIPFEGEVVIYDEVDPAPPAMTPETAAALVERLQQEDDAELTTPPVPEIDLSSTELTAGAPLLITLRVPYHPNRMYIKAWIIDPQTRSLTDEPRQLSHLTPNGRGQLEGSLQLTVPLGCLEILLEAIAVDMITQQESYKASVACSVNPPGIDSEPSPLDEFEL